jgi:predicted DNA-binding antitoxin AbrB/MazE fold protein
MPVLIVLWTHISIITTDNRGKKVMAGTVRARMWGGMLELLEKVDLPEGKEVSVTILERPTPRDTETEGILEALRATAGGWKGLVDAEALKRNIYADRLIATRPVPKL